MKQPEDTKTIDMLPAVKRGRGRPPSGLAPKSSSAERMAAKRERDRLSGIGTLTVSLPLDCIEALNAFIKFKDSNKDAVLEKLIRSQIMRKR